MQDLTPQPWCAMHPGYAAQDLVSGATHGEEVSSSQLSSRHATMPSTSAHIKPKRTKDRRARILPFARQRRAGICFVNETRISRAKCSLRSRCSWTSLRWCLLLHARAFARVDVTVVARVLVEFSGLRVVFREQPPVLDGFARAVAGIR